MRQTLYYRILSLNAKMRHIMAHFEFFVIKFHDTWIDSAGFSFSSGNTN